jgi:hypothetical protein
MSHPTSKVPCLRLLGVIFGAYFIFLAQPQAVRNFKGSSTAHGYGYCATLDFTTGSIISEEPSHRTEALRLFQ